MGGEPRQCKVTSVQVCLVRSLSRLGSFPCPWGFGFRLLGCPRPLSLVGIGEEALPNCSSNTGDASYTTREG